MRPFYLFILSAATLFFEVLLTRLFSHWLWGHYAFFVVSLSLLGFAASGVILARRSLRKRAFLRPLSFWLFFAAAFVVFGTVTRIPFDPARLGWDDRQFVWISAIYLACAVPFLFSGLYIGWSFQSSLRGIGRLYAANLAGSAVGALLPLLMLYLPLPGIPFSPYKALPQALRHPDARILATAWTPSARVDLIQSAAVRFAPGLSLEYRTTLPDQLGLALDGDRLDAVTRFDGDPSRLEFIAYLPSGAGYALLDRPRVLVLEGGGGLGVLEALFHGSGGIDVLERNREVVRLVDGSGITRPVYRHPSVRWFDRSPRNFLRGSEEKYDLIAMALPDVPAASSTGLYGLNEDYLYTVESFRACLDHLTERGLLSITRPLLFPPRELPRAVALAREALARAGAGAAADHLAIVESWGTWTLLVKRSPFLEADLRKIAQFAGKRGFRVVPADEAMSILGDRDYPFDLRPVTDDSPFFFHFFRPGRVREVYRSLGGRWEVFLEGGYLVYGALLLAVFWGTLLVLLPASIRRRPGRGKAGYFFLIGIAFMFVEMSLLQRAVLLFGDPTTGLSILLGGLLLLAGAGSLCSVRLVALLGGRVTLLFGALIVLIPCLAFAGLSPPALALAFPVLLLVGTPFPLAMVRLDPEEVPMAWAANGTASVIGAVLAVALALEIGYSGVMAAAAGCYLAAAISFPRRSAPDRSSGRSGRR